MRTFIINKYVCYLTGHLSVLMTGIIALAIITAPIYAQTNRYVAAAGDNQGGANLCTDSSAPCLTVAHAVEAAANGDVIQIAAGEYTESLNIEKSISLQGAGRDDTFLQAHEDPEESNTRVIIIPGDFEVEIAGMTIRSGSASTGFGFVQNLSGGGILNDGGSLLLENVTLSGNTAGYRGGGIYSRNGPVTLVNVIFSENSASNYGGGLYNEVGTVSLTDVDFTDNKGNSGGGGFYNADASPTLTNVNFTGNESDFRAAGMVTVDGSPVLTNVTFDGNTGGVVGGMLSENGSPTLNNVTFIRNIGSASSDVGAGGMGNVNSYATLTNVTFRENEGHVGGGMSNYNSTLILTDIDFIENKSDWGGAMDNRQDTVTLTNVNFIENMTGTGGGGMSNVNVTGTLDGVIFRANSSHDNRSFGGGGGMDNIESMLELNDVIFENNSALRNGGGMRNLRSSPVLTNVSFIGNTAEYNGGGIHNADESSPVLTNVLFKGNSALESFGGGGGMSNFNNSAPVLINVTFEENSTGSQGGGMENLQGSNATLSQVTFRNNFADFGGGGMYSAGGEITLTDVTFVNNTAGDRGGGMYSAGSLATLTNVLFSGNSAETGGGMRHGGGMATLHNVVFRGNEAVVAGGGMNVITSNPVLTNVAFIGNSALGYQFGSLGGGMSNHNGSSPILTNVTFSGNKSDEGGGLANSNNSSPTLTNVIIWNNQADNSTTDASASIWGLATSFDSSLASISYSLIANSGGSGTGWNAEIGIDNGNNIDADPLFFVTPDPDAAPTIVGNLHLRPGSPAINVGDPAVDISIFPTNDQGHPVDIVGNPRVRDGRIDIGAYEYTDEPTDVRQLAGLPESIELRQNYPNPFNPSTVIRYSVTEQTHVELVVFDLLGRRVSVLVDDHQTAGTYEVLFDAGNLPSGVYLYRLQTESETHYRKMTLIK